MTAGDDLVARARRLDADDPLASFRSRFVVEGDDIYLDGNSLGRLPRASIDAIDEVVRTWGREAVVGWETWLDLGTVVGDELAPLIGAARGEVAVCDQTSVNLHKLATAASDATRRPNIVSDRGNFPSDLYVLASVARRAGGRLVLVDDDPDPDEVTAAIDDDVGVVSFSHVNYRSGRIADAAAITAIAHAHGALVLWDLAHSVGAVPIRLTDWDADLAVGCTYKYLNGGPGSPGFLFVRKGLQTELESPITGWFGHADQFGFSTEFVPATSIRRFIVGTPAIVSMAATRVGIAITAEAGVDAIRSKSRAITTMFIDAIDTLVEPLDPRIRIVTPRQPDERGSHVAVSHPEAWQLSKALRSAGVIPDFREPDVLRFGFAPLSTTFDECLRAVQILADLLHTGSYRTIDDPRAGVT